jgi:hypothetical protein
MGLGGWGVGGQGNRPASPKSGSDNVQEWQTGPPTGGKRMPAGCDPVIRFADHFNDRLPWWLCRDVFDLNQISEKQGALTRFTFSKIEIIAAPKKRS